jgi:hypothetical protein
VIRRGVSSALGLALVLVACGNDGPPLLPDTHGPDAGPDVTFAETGVPTCTAGSGLSVCDCTELSFLSDVPNLVFALDRSGSMADMNKWTTIRKVIAGIMTDLGPRAAFGVAMFPDPNATDGCAPGAMYMSVRQGDTPAGTQGPTTTTALKVTSAPPGGGTPTAVTLQNLLPTLKKLSGRTFVILATDGGPNCNAAANCGVSMCMVNIESSASGCTPNTPPNCCDPTYYGPINCLDAQPTIDAVSAISGAGIPVYVIGVPGSGPYGGLLDQLATAGGTARTTEPFYYQVSTADQTAFQSALGGIAAKITGTCTLMLSEPPADPTHVNVYFDNVAVPADPVNGWTLSGPTVTLVGAACGKVMSGSVLNVRVVAGCPTVQPN